MVILQAGRRLLLNMLIFGLSSFVAAFGALKVAGIFALPVDNIFRALHEKPPQIALYLIIALTVIRFLQAGARPSGRPHILFWAGIMIMAIGLVMSSFVRFEGRIILTEGQQFSGSADEYVEGSVYLGKKASIPPFRLAAELVTLGLSKNGLIAKSVRLQTGYQSGASPLRTMTIDSMLPSFTRGFFFRTTGFGYSPLYRVTDQSGRLVLEESFVSLNLFPPDAEDAIRTLLLPHTYYLRYFPGGIEEAGGQGVKKGNFRIRIVRNLELLYRGVIALKEPVSFDSMIFTIEDIRQWAEIRVVKDHGIILFYAGFMLAAVSAIVLYRRNRYSGEDSRGECRRTCPPKTMPPVISETEPLFRASRTAHCPLHS